MVTTYGKPEGELKVDQFGTTSDGLPAISPDDYVKLEHAPREGYQWWGNYGNGWGIGLKLLNNGQVQYWRKPKPK